jgi:hypothetical protein
MFAFLMAMTTCQSTYLKHESGYTDCDDKVMNNTFIPLRDGDSYDFTNTKQFEHTMEDEQVNTDKDKIFS